MKSNSLFNRPSIVLSTFILIGVSFFLLTKSIINKPAPVDQTNESNLLQVSTSFFPLAEFAKKIGGDLVQVTTVTPETLEPHDFEPTPGDVTNIYKADIFLYNGAGVDVWAERLTPDLDRQGVAVFGFTNDLTLFEADETLDHQNERSYETILDPHIWLSPSFVKENTSRIADVFISADPEHAAEYADQAESFKKELIDLDSEYKKGLENCANRTIVTSHSAFKYLSKDYDFLVLPITGISPESEPSAGDLARLSDLIKETGIKYIFLETLANPELSQTISRENGVEILPFSSLEGRSEEEKLAGSDYLSIMRSNLESLRKAMICR